MRHSLLMQQAPVGVMHGFGSQVNCEPSQVPAQSPSHVIVQTLPTQQAPSAPADGQTTEPGSLKPSVPYPAIGSCSAGRLSSAKEPPSSGFGFAFRAKTLGAP